MTENSTPALIMKIGAYQLQNLVAQRTRFVYLDLRPEGCDLSNPLLQGSVRVDASTAVEKVQELAPSKDFPIVLLCETGANSARIAQEVDAAGFSNIFVVRDGYQGLF